LTSFLELFFNKADPNSITYSDFENFLRSEIEENLNLDYKSGLLIIGRQRSNIVNNKLDNNKSDRGFSDLARTIVGFANAEGGQLILGVQELPEVINGVRVKIRPGSVEPLPLGIVTKETIENKLRALIQFPLDDLRILPLRLLNDQEYICLIDVRQSIRAPHQLNSDKVYYQRRNFFTDAMEHYQINDLFGKRFAPSLDIELKRQGSDVDHFFLHPIIHNKGRAVAKYVLCTFTMENSPYSIQHAQGSWGNHNGVWEFHAGVNNVVYPDRPLDTDGLFFTLSNSGAEIKPIIFHFGLYAEDMTGKKVTLTVDPRTYI
jgi:Putative DNA-binding domain